MLGLLRPDLLDGGEVLAPLHALLLLKVVLQLFVEGGLLTIVLGGLLAGRRVYIMVVLDLSHEIGSVN